MRQFFGFIIICLSIVGIGSMMKLILTESNAIEEKKQTITKSVSIPSVNIVQPLTLLDRNGNIFSEEYIEWREHASLNEIPSIAQQLFIYSEDENFYDHIGFDISAIARAVVVNSGESDIQQGGSTITQQLVRMRYLTQEKTYERKLLELFYAHELEKQHDKEEILEMYLNEAYFSNQVYGIAAASSYYFSKPLSKLNTAEIAFLAAIPNNPTVYDPIRNFDNTKKRQQLLLNVLEKNKIISSKENELLQAKKITLNVKKKIQNYPAYSSFVLLELRKLIANNEGYAMDTEENRKKNNEKIDKKIAELSYEGATIYTALNPTKQAQDEARLNAALAQVDFQASATVIDNTTREIISVFPGKSYRKYDLHRAYQQPRQPGSALKPIAAFAPFINETGYNESYIVSGGPYCVGNYCPSNYGGGIYGNVTLSTALKYSYNTSALRLASNVGIDKIYTYLDRFNFASLTNDDRSYAAILGGLSYGVTTTELADAYTSFIDGTYKPAHTIRKIIDKNGKTLYSWNEPAEQIWSQKTITTMRNMLSDVVTSGTASSVYNPSGYVGAKTGTTNNYRDFWLAGLTNEYTTAVWIGYDKGQSMERFEDAKIHHHLFNLLIQ